MIQELWPNSANSSIQDQFGNTILHVTAKNNQTDTLWYILKNISQDVNNKNNYGQRPIHLAAKYGHYHAIILLIKAGSDLNDR